MTEQATETRMPHGWRAAPMPERIAALPRDRKGFPIPWVAEWSSSTPASYVVMNGGFGILPYGRIDCDCTIGEGVPELGRQCPARQRRCMAERLCQVCSFPIAEDEDLHFLGGEEVGIYWEPPLHAECAAYSLQVCPGITRRPGMSVHVSRTRTLYDKFQIFTDANEGSLTEFALTGTRPALSLILPSALIYHGARPVGGQRYLAADWLATYLEV